MLDGQTGWFLQDKVCDFLPEFAVVNVPLPGLGQELSMENCGIPLFLYVLGIHLSD